MANATRPDIDNETSHVLPIGSQLSGGQFVVTGHLGAGGFGMTYRAEDLVLGREIVLKECYPEDFCARKGTTVLPRTKSYVKPFRAIVDMFMREARSLAQLRHPNIVGVHRAFEENGTAYMVLDLIDGQDLLSLMKTDDTPLSPGRVRDILIQLLDAIEKVHEIDLLHRDISPDNIIIESNGTPVLIDFGAARAEASRRTRAISSLLVVKDGYSPQELYVAGSDQTPSSDLYALAATFYHLISGAPPPPSQKRLIEIAGQRPDPCTPLTGKIKGYDPEFLAALDTALKVHPADRIQTAARWRALIKDASTSSDQTPLPRATSKDLDLRLERSLTRLVEETNDEVRKSQSLPVEKTTPKPQREPSAKPDWIADFNKETSKLDVVVKVAEKSLPSEPLQAAAVPLPGSKPQTDWIDLANQKQERIREELARELEELGLGDELRVTSKPPDVATSPTQEPSAPPLRKPPTVLPERLVAGLFVVVALMFVMRAYDRPIGTIDLVKADKTNSASAVAAAPIEVVIPTSANRSEP